MIDFHTHVGRIFLQYPRFTARKPSKRSDELEISRGDFSLRKREPPMIIDAHVHLKHGDIKKTEYSAESIIRIMDEAGVDKSVVFAMCTTTRRSIEMASRAAEKFKNRLIPFVYALPSYEKPVIAEIEEAIKYLGFKGIKLHIGECTLERYVSEPVLRLAGKYRVPCLIDCAGRYRLMENLADSFPDTKMIVAHFGRYLCKDESLIDKFIKIAKKHDNVYLDTSGVIIPKKIKEAVDLIGSSRIIFGTDGPTEEGARFVLQEINKIKKLGLKLEDEREVLGETIAKLLKL